MWPFICTQTSIFISFLYCCTVVLSFPFLFCSCLVDRIAVDYVMLGRPFFCIHCLDPIGHRFAKHSWHGLDYLPLQQHHEHDNATNQEALREGKIRTTHTHTHTLSPRTIDRSCSTLYELAISFLICSRPKLSLSVAHLCCPFAR